MAMEIIKSSIEEENEFILEKRNQINQINRKLENAIDMIFTEISELPDEEAERQSYGTIQLDDVPKIIVTKNFFWVGEEGEEKLNNFLLLYGNSYEDLSEGQESKRVVMPISMLTFSDDGINMVWTFREFITTIKTQYNLHNIKLPNFPKTKTPDELQNWLKRLLSGGWTIKRFPPKGKGTTTKFRIPFCPLVNLIDIEEE